MSENQLPAAPHTTDADDPATHPAPRRTWRDRMPSGRKVITAGAVVAGLAVGGAGFGAGYAVGHDDVATTGTTTQQTTDGFGGQFDGRGFPGDGRGPMGDMSGQLPGGPMGGTTQDGTGQQPDFDGDGQPDTDGGTDSDSGTGTDDGTISGSLNS
ncbi:hypothetical protein [Nocardioides baculatus]|uniref:Uncharacterized protein n=1 Tax=Nocardioides baculatus TaxID=2801337 RepID=A0ABS1L5I4_9ACTN|nr:hypothetical protein [Nocardioides baculatus]MBL0746698.1 hypothetical protein [Nocardioides baculatus]